MPVFSFYALHIKYTFNINLCCCFFYLNVCYLYLNAQFVCLVLICPVVLLV